jgi:hypothetical protein
VELPWGAPAWGGEGCVVRRVGDRAVAGVRDVTRTVGSGDWLIDAETCQVREQSLYTRIQLGDVNQREPANCRTRYSFYFI